MILHTNTITWAYLLLLFTLVNTYSAIHVQNTDYDADTTFVQQLPLTIRQQPVSQVALKGNRVTFKCEFEAASNEEPGRIQSTLTQTIDYTVIKISWLHDGIPVIATNTDDPSQSLLTRTQYVIDRNSLVILAYEPLKHSGQYRCLINNTMFAPPLVILSEPANLSVASIEDFASVPVDELAESHLDMSEGNVAIIACKLPASNPPALPVFYMNDVG